MGDRANCYIKMGAESGVYLYTHWGGTELPSVVKEALESPAGRARIDDDAYLARIVFEKMIEGASDKETGYGISPHLTDNEYPIIVLYPDKGYYAFAKPGRENDNDLNWKPIDEFPGAWPDD